MPGYGSTLRTAKRILIILVLLLSVAAALLPNVKAQTITLSPASAPVGIIVTVSGTGFSASDTSCSLSGSVVTSPTCTVSSGTLTASFVAAGVTAGPYIVTATGSASDSALAPFTVTVPSFTTLTGDPFCSLSVPCAGAGYGIPPLSPPGVTFSGTGLSGTDTSCTVSGPPVGSGGCSITTPGNWIGNFTVACAAPGQYIVTVTGSPGGSYDREDSAQANFIVTLSFTPCSSGIGSEITFAGQPFPSAPTSCSISSPTSGNLI
ncbi:MAG: hypothetical protein ABSF09_09875, partial [Candidatus Bathyarchaeia archaeon]